MQHPRNRRSYIVAASKTGGRSSYWKQRPLEAWNSRAELDRPSQRQFQKRAADVGLLRSSIRTYFNLELACTDEMLAIAIAVHPDQVTLVPERRQEVTTEGGLDVIAHALRVEHAVTVLREAGIRTSLFIGSDPSAVRMTQRLGADSIELNTGEFANHPNDLAPLAALRHAAVLAVELGLAVHAGHGLTAANLGPVSAIPEIEELNIGHSIVSRAIFIGLAAAVSEVRRAMDAARGPESRVGRDSRK